MELVDHFINETDFRLFRQYCRFKELLKEDKKASEYWHWRHQRTVSLRGLKKTSRSPQSRSRRHQLSRSRQYRSRSGTQPRQRSHRRSHSQGALKIL
ncbi:hypothetical protein PoB_000181900 [Plakobranchus ocellatus]|uniref:RGS domain-containing protein n=1 Tax=Plakobranchus ocellatus TaxID=259542 RepID=A0AAV3XWS7_9GAST|nr:hypothetical protein PoB_000181900 [Plakobranchus ocellatus]